MHAEMSATALYSFNTKNMLNISQSEITYTGRLHKLLLLITNKSVHFICKQIRALNIHQEGLSLQND